MADPTDPLLQPCRLKHLTQRNRVMSTAHEPSCAEEGMPKHRYRLYRREKAKGGIALTMTAVSAVVSPDSPAVCGNLLTCKDEETPDAVFLGTGGLPDSEVLEAGNDLVVSAWDIVSGAVAPAACVLVFDDNGNHPGMQAAEVLAETGAVFRPRNGRAEPRAVCPCLPAPRRAHHHQHAAALGAARGVATLGSDDGPGTEARVVEHGTEPLDELYFMLRPKSMNGGEVDHAALLAGRPQIVVRNPGGRFRLWRIGDAVASRNIHAAVFYAPRLEKDL